MVRPMKRIGLYGGPGNGRQLVIEWDCHRYVWPVIRPVVFDLNPSPQSFLTEYDSHVTYAPANFDAEDWDVTRWWRPVENKAYAEWRKMEEEKRSRW